MIDPGHGELSIARQCSLVSISRSSFYYEGKGESRLNLALMRLIDEPSLPFFPSCLPTTPRLSGTGIILSQWILKSTTGRSSRCLFHRLVPANLCKGMRVPAASTSPQREIDRIRAGRSGREAFVTMMQTADLGQGNDRSGPGRLNGSSIRCVLVERQVGP